MKKAILNWLARRGIKVITRNDPRFDPIPKNADPEFAPAFKACAPYTLTSFESQYALWKAVQYVMRSEIPGDFVECGVFRGGSVMVAAKAFEHFGDTSRRLYLYDTFEGMPDPTEQDVDFKGRTPQQHLRTWSVNKMSEMTNSPLDEVRRNVLSTGLAAERFVFVKGKVEETIPGTLPPGPIAVLRLDTDWYESTRHELEHMYDRLSPGGVLIIDDYGHWEGSRRAVDEFLTSTGVPLLLLPLASGRIAVKPGL